MRAESTRSSYQKKFASLGIESDVVRSVRVRILLPRLTRVLPGHHLYFGYCKCEIFEGCFTVDTPVTRYAQDMT